MNIQSFNYDNISVSFRNDGYLHATQIAKHFGKLPKDYLKTEQTREYIAALADNCVRRKILTDKNQLVIIKQGGMEQGTWLHPKLAIHFARWLDPRFAVWCDEQIEQIISGSLKLEPIQPALPYGSVVLSENDIHNLKTLLRYLPYMQAYFHRTEDAVRSLNRGITYKVHDRFADAGFFAGALKTRLQFSCPSWRDVIHELG